MAGFRLVHCLADAKADIKENKASLTDTAPKEPGLKRFTKEKWGKKASDPAPHKKVMVKV